LNYIKILLKRFPALANDLISYMSIIRSAVLDVPFEKMYKFDQQFRLRMARDHRRSWATIDGQTQFVATGGTDGLSILIFGEYLCAMFGGITI
jgi:hypothetical protein